MRANFDAIVIGAGPAGSTAALLLARAGWHVALIEKQRFPRRKVCGECMAASNLPLLDALGIGTAFSATAGPPLRHVALMRGRSVVSSTLPAAAHARHRYGRALGREILDSLLLDQARAAGVHVMQPWSLQAIDGEVGAWRCTVRSVATDAAVPLTAPVVVAANGSWEVLPSARPQAHAHRRPSDLLAFKANFTNAMVPAGVLPVLSFNGGYGGMVVAEAGITTVACCIRRDALERLRLKHPGVRAGDAVEAMLREQIFGVRSALHCASREGAWLAAGPLNPGVRLQPDDGLFRIGNAAGEAHPIIGEGMSMAIQSAWLLCRQLMKHNPASLTWQRETQRVYAADWRHHFSARMRLAEGFAVAAMQPTLAAPLLLGAMAWPGLLTAGARWGGKVRCAVDARTLSALACDALPRNATGLVGGAPASIRVQRLRETP